MKIWTRQPQFATPVDLGLNPGFVFLGSVGADLVTGRSLAQINAGHLATRSPAIAGVGIKPGGAAPYASGMSSFTKQAFILSEGASIVWVGSISQADATYSVIASRYRTTTEASSYAGQWRLEISATNEIRLAIRSDAGTTTIINSGLTLTVGKQSVITVTMLSSSVLFSLNGVTSSQSATPQGYAGSGGNDTAIAVGTTSAGGYNGHRYTNCALFYGVYGKPPDNTWQIFQPLHTRIFVPVSAGSISDLIISMTKANALATGIQAQILYDQLIQMLSASATTPSKSFNIDKTLDLLKANAQATGTQFNVDIAMLLAMAVANAQATGVKANIDKAINIQSGNSIASGGNILLDKAIGLVFANSNASGVKLNIDKTINVAVANAQASGITTLLDIVKNLVVGNAVANSNGFGSGSVLNLNSIAGIATGTKAALDKVINQAVANATATAPKFNLDKAINTIVANALATGIITNLDRQILANSASAIATGITTILEYATALAMNSGSASATGTTIRIDKQILIAAGIANATGVAVSVVFAPFTYEPAFIIFSSETDLVILDVVRGDIIAAPQQVLQTLNPESRNNSFIVDSRGEISAPEQILQSLVSESRTNVFDSTTRISTFNRE